jgi:hypothetical protein
VAVVAGVVGEVGADEAGGSGDSDFHLSFDYVRGWVAGRSIQE